jgi:hypothetical protein
MLNAFVNHVAHVAMVPLVSARFQSDCRWRLPGFNQIAGGEVRGWYTISYRSQQHLQQNKQMVSRARALGHSCDITTASLEDFEQHVRDTSGFHRTQISYRATFTKTEFANARFKFCHPNQEADDITSLVDRMHDFKVDDPVRLEAVLTPYNELRDYQDALQVYLARNCEEANTAIEV